MLRRFWVLAPCAAAFAFAAPAPASQGDPVAAIEFDRLAAWPGDSGRPPAAPGADWFRIDPAPAAVPARQAALGLSPDDPRPAFQLAVSSDRAGRADAPADSAAAAGSYRLAAEVMDAKAMTRLGFAYWNGDGVAKDRAEAARWYRKAAEAGDPAAMTNLGFAYESGDGAPKDVAEAVRWYKKAAAAGDAHGMANLANM
jgi:TPR repeat protein